jgi:hypothetical protein
MNIEIWILITILLLTLWNLRTMVTMQTSLECTHNAVHSIGELLFGDTDPEDVPLSRDPEPPFGRVKDWDEGTEEILDELD